MKEERKIDGFKDMVKGCNLNNVLFKGQKFTWFDTRDRKLIKERLDRALINLEWMEQFPNTQGFDLFAIGSDHSPIVLLIEMRDKRAPKEFKFESNWLGMEECKEIVIKG